MAIEDTARAEILQVSRALRDWSVGLRAWSQSARDAAEVQRARALALLHAGDPVSPYTVPSRHIDVHTGRDGLPCLDLVGVDELIDIVAGRASLGRNAATRAVQRGVLCAGYRTDCDGVTAADAFDIVEEALRFHG